MIPGPVFRARLRAIIQHVVPEDVISQPLVILVALWVPEMAVHAPVNGLLLREHGLVLAWVGIDILLDLQELLFIDGEH